jgi:hypothetical protein
MESSLPVLMNFPGQRRRRGALACCNILAPFFSALAD